MSREMNADSTESFRVIVAMAGRYRGTFGPFATAGTAKAIGTRECKNDLGKPKAGYAFRIQRTTTDWQDVE